MGSDEVPLAQLISDKPIKRIKMNKILLVEDDQFFGPILKDQLEMHDYEVDLLRIPSNTVESLLEDNFDLVIMDKLLNGIDGTRICTEIRNTPQIADIPVLMMSGLDGAKEICMEAGANNFIAKPFEVTSFLESIEATINESKDLKI